MREFDKYYLRGDQQMLSELGSTKRHDEKLTAQEMEMLCLCDCCEPEHPQRLRSLSWQAPYLASEPAASETLLVSQAAATLSALLWSLWPQPATYLLQNNPQKDGA